MSPDSIDSLRAQLAAFVAERNWEQFHTPKNLALALVAEVGELVEHFQWRTDAELTPLGGGELREAIEDELADVLIYLVRLGDVLAVDLLAASERKVRYNARRYPAGEVSGSAEKRPPPTDS